MTELGKALAGTAEAMKQNPSCLAAILLAGMFSILTYLSLKQDREYYQARQMALIQRCNFTPPADDGKDDFDIRRMQ